MPAPNEVCVLLLLLLLVDPKSPPELEAPKVLAPADPKPPVAGFAAPNVPPVLLLLCAPNALPAVLLAPNPVVLVLDPKALVLFCVEPNAFPVFAAEPPNIPPVEGNFPNVLPALEPNISGQLPVDA